MTEKIFLNLGRIFTVYTSMEKARIEYQVSGNSRTTQERRMAYAQIPKKVFHRII